MWVRHVYYYIKPFMPRQLQIALRRQQAARTFKRCGKVWPIDENAGRPPLNWSGWPDRKRFAFILTHDVDTARGQERTPDLAALEDRLGFRSSYNFVPLRYAVSPHLRSTLVANGFEVGVHGLYHDGKYYSSKKNFLERAERINQFLREWGAVGYRAPSMLHKLEWFHHFNIEYDASTFDTDPFEPNSKGACTIFPFLVNGVPGYTPYVELPYTLPQDFTVFVLLHGHSIDFWKRKMEWVVQKGGMVLLNTHPDYMSFVRGRPPGNEEYPVRYYEEFLEHVRTTYAGQYWHVLPRELARFWRGQYPLSPEPGGADWTAAAPNS